MYNVYLYGKKINNFIHTRKDFAEKSKILLDTDLEIILLNHQNNFVEILKNNEIMI